MNKITKSILMIAAFVLFIAAAVFAYGTLKDRVPRNVDIAQNSETPIPGLDQNNEQESKNEPEAGLEGEPDKEDDGDSNNGVTDPDNFKIKALDFTVTDMDGNSVKLSDMFGKPIVLNFWASWCGPCRDEMPEFNKVYEELKDEVTFMMVDLVDGKRETEEIGKNFIAEQGYTFPVYFDSEQEAAITYGIRFLPTSLFIDKDGYIVTGAQGSINEGTLRSNIELIR